MTRPSRGVLTSNNGVIRTRMRNAAANFGGFWGGSNLMVPARGFMVPAHDFRVPEYGFMVSKHDCYVPNAIYVPARFYGPCAWFYGCKRDLCPSA